MLKRVVMFLCTTFSSLKDHIKCLKPQILNKKLNEDFLLNFT